MEYITRSEAENLGLKRYFTGKLCKNNHVCERYVVNRHCVDCQLKVAKDWLRDNSEAKKKITKKWVNKNKDKVAVLKKRSREKYKDKYNLKSAEWKRNNKNKVSLYCNNRRARKLKATPIWADMDRIAKFYTDKPEGMQVDHIIPLVGVNEHKEHIVCGLHVHYNLQYLTKQENLKKSNKFIRSYS